MAKLDYEQMANDIVMAVGGPDNIKAVAHCMTRIRFLLKDPKNANTTDVKSGSSRHRWLRVFQDLSPEAC